MSYVENDLANVLAKKRIIICVGSGGVGKTTTAAALALQGVLMGKRTLVLTIDPAKRLASSLGVGALGHDVVEIDPALLADAGAVGDGRLFAMMLDQKKAFDEVVTECASSPEAVKRVLANPIYQQISGSLSGSQEYAAMTKLQQFEADDGYDLLIVDTPPTAHALDFLDAPKKMTEALDSTALKWFRRIGDGGSLSALGRTGKFVLKRLAKFIGSDFVNDIGVFFGEFEDVVAGFRAKAEQTFQLLRSDKTSFVLVASPEPTSINEAQFFHARLKDSQMPFSHFVVNRMHSQSAPFPTRLDIEAALPQNVGNRAMVIDGLETLASNWQALRDRDQAAVSVLAALDPRVAIAPALSKDVHSVADLSQMGRYLLGHDEPICR